MAAVARTGARGTNGERLSAVEDREPVHSRDVHSRYQARFDEVPGASGVLLAKYVIDLMEVSKKVLILPMASWVCLEPNILTFMSDANR